jgi:hypothetical protein
MGGGFRESRIGELAIARAGLILKADGVKIDLVNIRNDPDEAALIGSLHLAPAWIFKGHDSILAVDIGGTNIRAGVVLPNVAKAADLTKASVWKSEKWRHADEEKLNREKAVDELIGMLKDLMKRAKKEGYNLAPFIGIACPGKIEEDGSIAKGAQNLPGNWESSRFNLPARLAEAIPQSTDTTPTILYALTHAVVQGLSEVPFKCADVEALRGVADDRNRARANARFNHSAPSETEGETGMKPQPSNHITRARSAPGRRPSRRRDDGWGSAIRLAVVDAHRRIRTGATVIEVEAVVIDRAHDRWTRELPGSYSDVRRSSRASRRRSYAKLSARNRQTVLSITMKSAPTAASGIGQTHPAEAGDRSGSSLARFREPDVRRGARGKASPLR